MNPNENASSDINAPALLDEIASFLRRYLVCDEHQITVLALWVVHTWCFRVFHTIPYLEIRSSEPESGKTLCLKLLHMLCAEPVFAHGADPKTLIARLITGRTFPELTKDGMILQTKPFTIFLDDCHHTFGSSERQQLVALLTSGTAATSCFAYGDADYYTFSPKAFAGNSPLPRSLAARCIPILLRRRMPSEKADRFNPFTRHDSMSHLTESISRWANANLRGMKNVRENSPVDAPVSLTPHQQDCAAPLIHIADLIGGVWPEKARAAIAWIFGATEASDSVEVLRDIRQLFLEKKDPPYLLSRDLLAGLRELEYRPWSAWPKNAGRRLGKLLGPLQIKSQDIGVDGKGLKGYYMESFQDAWDRYLPHIAVQSAMETTSAMNPRCDNPLSSQ